ncbi:MAG: cohesin domain-containing protein [Patescibacteria group bacterium]
MEKKFLNSIVTVFALGVLFFTPGILHAASLNFSPPSGSHTVGSTFSVSVNVESSDQAMNAASGVVSFPWDKLEVVSLSKAGSIFSLWPAEPSFSNSGGTVSFEGIVLNPGYTGANGKILTITFKVRNTGTANVSFSSGSVLANDGTGTNILNSFRVATYTLGSASTPAPVSPQEGSASTGNALGIISATHPDENMWYVDNQPEFSWQLPTGALEVRTFIGKSSSATPSVSYTPPISKKKVDELPDGTYYFAARVRTASGWSAVSRFRVNIDTTPPKPFSITFPHGNTGWDPQPVIFFNTTDGESGISHYDIKIGSDGKPIKSVPIAESNPYVLPSQLPGTYTLLVTAVDNAGNVRNGTSEFTIETIDMPVITYYPETLEEGDILKIRGTMYPDSEVTLFIREGDTLISEEFTRSNSLGDFVVVTTKRLDPGVYTVTARVKNARGAQSAETPPLTMTVKSALVEGVIGFVLKYLSFAILVVLSLAGLVGGGAYIWYRSLGVVRRLRRKSREAEKVLEKSFTILRKDIAAHVAKLKSVKRKLTAEEAEFLEQFEDELGEAEKTIAKEIQDISHS